MNFQTLIAKIKSFVPNQFMVYGKEGTGTVTVDPGLEGFKKHVQIHHGTDEENGKQTVVCCFTHKPSGVAILINDTVFNLMPAHKREKAFQLLQEKVQQVERLKQQRDRGTYGRKKT